MSAPELVCGQDAYHTSVRVENRHGSDGLFTRWKSDAIPRVLHCVLLVRGRDALMSLPRGRWLRRTSSHAGARAKHPV